MPFAAGNSLESGLNSPALAGHPELFPQQHHRLGVDRRGQAGVGSPSQGQFPPLEVNHVEPALQRLQRDTIRTGLIRLRVYGVEKTLVDCFRHRSRLGMEVVLEALRDASSQRRINVDELWRQAKAQRLQRMMAPYLVEALL